MPSVCARVCVLHLVHVGGLIVRVCVCVVSGERECVYFLAPEATGEADKDTGSTSEI